MLANLYSKKVVEMVSFNWRVSGTNRQGCVSLEDMKLPVSRVRLITPIPLIMGEGMHSLVDSGLVS